MPFSFLFVGKLSLKVQTHRSSLLGTKDWSVSGNQWADHPSSVKTVIKQWNCQQIIMRWSWYKVFIKRTLLRVSVSIFMGTFDYLFFIPNWLAVCNKYIWCMPPIAASTASKLLGDYKFKKKISFFVYLYFLNLF